MKHLVDTGTEAAPCITQQRACTVWYWTFRQCMLRQCMEHHLCWMVCRSTLHLEKNSSAPAPETLSRTPCSTTRSTAPAPPLVYSPAPCIGIGVEVGVGVGVGVEEHLNHVASEAPAPVPYLLHTGTTSGSPGAALLAPPCRPHARVHVLP